MCQDSSVIKVTAYGQDDQGFLPSRTDTILFAIALRLALGPIWSPTQCVLYGQWSFQGVIAGN
jgi:hypothetical protein